MLDLPEELWENLLRYMPLKHVMTTRILNSRWKSRNERFLVKFVQHYTIPPSPNGISLKLTLQPMGIESHRDVLIAMHCVAIHDGNFVFEPRDCWEYQVVNHKDYRRRTLIKHTTCINEIQLPKTMIWATLDMETRKDAHRGHYSLDGLVFLPANELQILDSCKQIQYYIQSTVTQVRIQANRIINAFQINEE